tara:strand:+ start:163 stop:516 length:354 start_codon:yes stop_codon:yes gene_type:complete
LILSKAILCTGGLEAFRVQINAAQNQKCFVLKDLPLSVRWRRCSRLGRAGSPTVGERALPASQKIGNLDTWEVSRGALNWGHLQNRYLHRSSLDFVIRAVFARTIDACVLTLLVASN